MIDIARPHWAVVCVALGLTLCAAVGIRAAAGAGSEAPVPLDTYVGRVENSPSLIALLTDGKAVAGYVSDPEGNSVWLATAELKGEQSTLSSRDGFELGTVRRDGDRFRGRISLGGLPRTFRASPAKGLAGLYYASAPRLQDSIEVGWIVLPNGSQAGTVDTLVGGEFDRRPAPRLDLSDPLVRIPPFQPLTPTELRTEFFDRNPRAG